MSARVAFHTLGCRLNQAESDHMAEELEGLGFVPAHGDAPDVVVINTCTVTREATKASRSAIRRAIRNHPDAKVVVIGCYAVSNPDDIEAIAGVDAVLSNDDKEAFVEALGKRTATRPLLQIRTGAPSALVSPLSFSSRVRANLKVQTGCDEWCTFCIIPTTRGPLRSFDEDDLVDEARARVNAGTRELVLTGVHLGKYSFDRKGTERDLVRLLERLLSIDGLLRIRLSSILSQHLTDDLVGLMVDDPRVCRHLHVPLQSGDDGVLKAMHRPYDIERYIESVSRAQQTIPGLALATDVIVGFPGESERAFEGTMEVVRQMGFSKLHVFRYSPRPETQAASMPDEIAPEVKRERSRRLIALGNEMRRAFLTAHLGRVLHVLVEDERVVDGSGVCSGQTDDYVRVWFEGRDKLGEIVPVSGASLRADGIEGEEARESAGSPTRELSTPGRSR
jgi:threonylcarbamoyladenosine tRNA methylthiotransferase MtaB